MKRSTNIPKCSFRTTTILILSILLLGELFIDVEAGWFSKLNPFSKSNRIKSYAKKNNVKLRPKNPFPSKPTERTRRFGMVFQNV